MDEDKITPSIRWLCEYRSSGEITAETLRELDQWLCQIPYYTPPGRPRQYQVADWQPDAAGLRFLIRSVREVTGDNPDDITLSGVEVYWFLSMRVMIEHDLAFGRRTPITPASLRQLDDRLFDAAYHGKGDRRPCISGRELRESEILSILEDIRQMTNDDRDIVLTKPDQANGEDDGSDQQSK